MALIEIRRFYGPEEAQVAASMLRASGIDVLVQNEQLGMTDFLLRNAAGGFRLWVPEEDEDSALELLPPLPPPQRQAHLDRKPAERISDWPAWLRSLLPR